MGSLSQILGPIIIVLLLSFITPNGSRNKNTIIYTKYKNTFTKQNIKTDYKLRVL